LKPFEEINFLNNRINNFAEIKNFLSKNVKFVFIKTFGCQQNNAESEKIKGLFAKIGLKFCSAIENADIILYNTCAVRKHAEEKIFGNIGQIKKLKVIKPKLIVIICGCMSQQNEIAEKIKDFFPFVDLILGTNFLHKLPELLYQKFVKKEKYLKYLNNDSIIYENFPVFRTNNFKTSVPIMYGCENFCSYCVVPYVKGKERSRNPENIYNEIMHLIQNGYREILLLGQNVNSYGKNLKNPVSFSSLLKKIDEIPGDFRIRFMTSHPKDANRELIDVIAQSEHICKSMHLPVQSGSNKILKVMNRKYTRENYLKIVEYAKKTIPNLQFTSDIIVGFPGETEEDFSDTLNLVQEVEFANLFTFIFSPRAKTLAAYFEDTITNSEKTARIIRLLNKQKKI
jgi:tRNA-2-methylthio-N6-dimethylallyladenosine synthase